MQEVARFDPEKYKRTTHRELQRFEGPSGFEAPCTMAIAVGTRP